MKHHLPLPLRALRAAALSSITALGMAAACLAQTVTPVVYPAKGQSAQQQDKDRYECHDWARRQSGYDPTRPATAAPAPATGGAGSTGSSTAGSMTAGALGGAAVAELGDHDAGRGAAIGALGGAALGKLKEARQQQARQQQQAQQQQAAQGSQRSLYERSWSACLEARGYTVR